MPFGSPLGMNSASGFTPATGCVAADATAATEAGVWLGSDWARKRVPQAGHWIFLPSAASGTFKGR
jgi:hypothetical protein